jgi:general secretion pathway protein K
MIEPGERTEVERVKPMDERPHVHRARLDERGFALMAVLWVLAGIAALALVARLAGRDAVRTALNRQDLLAGAWRAEDCVARVRAAASDALRATGEAPGRDAWARLDSVAAASPLLAGSGCEVEVRAAGAGLDVNTADAETLRRFVSALGASGDAADSLVDALEDWRDADDEPRPLGAEAAWYRAAGLRPPRNGPLADARELARVRGFGRFGGLDTLVALEGGRVPLNRAPRAVLAALPGMTPEAADLVVELRARGEPLGDPAALEPLLTEGARWTLLRGYAELAPQLSPAPEAWVVTARGRVGTPPVTAVLEVRLARAGGRAAVVRRRAWSE